MKTFNVKSNGKSYTVKANDAQHAAKLVKMITDKSKWSRQELESALKHAKAAGDKKLVEMLEEELKFIDDSVKDGRRINYDDDIIKVTLNGKEVFKGYAEEWVDDDFYSKFKWTGSQYEASNSKGKWVVTVLDSKKIKDEASSREVLQQLLDDETAAVGAYDVVIKNEDGKLDEKAIEVLRAIRDDELRHRENLNAIMSGNITEKNLTDSSKKE